MDTAAHWDGLCPLCLKAELERLRAALEPTRIMAVLTEWNQVRQVLHHGDILKLAKLLTVNA